MLAGDDAEHDEIPVFAKALFFEAFAQVQLGAVHDDPVVGRREAGFLTNFFGRYFFHEAQGEHGPVPGRQPLLAAAQGVVQLLLLKGGVGGAPARGGLQAGPVAVFGNEEIGFGGTAAAQLVEADAGRAGLAAVGSMILRRKMTNSHVRSKASPRKAANPSRALRKVFCTNSSAALSSLTRLRAKRYSSLP